MATTKSFIILLFSTLLLLKYITPLSQHYNFQAPNQVSTKVVLNLAFLKSKQENDHVFPAFGSYSHGSASRKMGPIPLQQGMVALTEKNFTDFIESNRYVMVIFYTSEGRVAPEHANICMQLTGASVVAKVDFNEEKTLAEKYKIVRYPSIYFFPGGALGDKYYSEVFLEVDAGKHVEGKFRGNFYGSSDGYVVESVKNDEKFTGRKQNPTTELEDDKSDGEQIVTLKSGEPVEVVEPRKNENLLRSNQAEAKWNGNVYHEDGHYEAPESNEGDPKWDGNVHAGVLQEETNQMAELNTLTTEDVQETAAERMID